MTTNTRRAPLPATKSSVDSLRKKLNTLRDDVVGIQQDGATKAELQQLIAPLQEAVNALKAVDAAQTPGNLDALVQSIDALTAKVEEYESLRKDVNKLQRQARGITTANERVAAVERQQNQTASNVDRIIMDITSLGMSVEQLKELVSNGGVGNKKAIIQALRDDGVDDDRIRRVLIIVDGEDCDFDDPRFVAEMFTALEGFKDKTAADFGVVHGRINDVVTNIDTVRTDVTNIKTTLEEDSGNGHLIASAVTFVVVTVIAWFVSVHWYENSTPQRVFTSIGLGVIFAAIVGLIMLAFTKSKKTETVEIKTEKKTKKEPQTEATSGTRWYNNFWSSAKAGYAAARNTNGSPTAPVQSQSTQTTGQSGGPDSNNSSSGTPAEPNREPASASS